MGERNTFVTPWIYSKDAIKEVETFLDNLEYCIYEFIGNKNNAGMFAGMIKNTYEGIPDQLMDKQGLSIPLILVLDSMTTRICQYDENGAHEYKKPTLVY